MYRLGIWLVALTLVFNGAATYAWNNPSEMRTAIAQDHYDGTDAEACNITSGDNVAIVADLGHSHGSKYNHVKCCGTCNVASLAPSATADSVTFSYKAATFSMARHHLVGHLVALDPDIPKSIV